MSQTWTVHDRQLTSVAPVTNVFFEWENVAEAPGRNKMKYSRAINDGLPLYDKYTSSLPFLRSERSKGLETESSEMVGPYRQ